MSGGQHHAIPALSLRTSSWQARRRAVDYMSLSVRVSHLRLGATSSLQEPLDALVGRCALSGEGGTEPGERLGLGGRGVCDLGMLGCEPAKAREQDTGEADEPGGGAGAGMVDEFVHGGGSGLGTELVEQAAAFVQWDWAGWQAVTECSAVDGERVGSGGQGGEAAFQGGQGGGGCCHRGLPRGAVGGGVLSWPSTAYTGLTAGSSWLLARSLPTRTAVPSLTVKLTDSAAGDLFKVDA